MVGARKTYNNIQNFINVLIKADRTRFLLFLPQKETVPKLLVTKDIFRVDILINNR